jgi:hypothetical protein
MKCIYNEKFKKYNPQFIVTDGNNSWNASISFSWMKTPTGGLHLAVIKRIKS